MRFEVECFPSPHKRCCNKPKRLLNVLGKHSTLLKHLVSVRLMPTTDLIEKISGINNIPVIEILPLLAYIKHTKVLDVYI